MGWFDKLKSAFIKKKEPTTSALATYGTDFSSLSYNYNQEFNATYTNCASALARHISKIEVAVKNESSELFRFKYLSRILMYRPNPIQTASSFWFSLAYDYYFGGVAFAYIERDYFSNISETKIKHMWPISPQNISGVKLLNKQIYIEFMLDGQSRIDTADNFLILVKKPKSSNCVNSYDPSLDKIIEILATNEEGIVKAIENSNLIRFIVSSAGNMSEKMVEDQQKKFDKRLTNANSVLYITNAESLQQVTNQSKWATSEDVKEMKKEIYNFFGVSEKFLTSEYDENGWQSTYEGAIEPFITMLSQELTVKLFTEREFAVGNRIEVVTNPLQTASLATRIKLAEAYLKLPTIKPNVICELLYLPKLENGDKEVQSLNFVNATQVDNYQGVDEGEEESEPDNIEPQEQGGNENGTPEEENQ